MNTILGIGGMLASCLVLCTYGVGASAAQPKLSISTGTFFSRGSYGGDSDIDELYVPVSASIDLSRVAYRITVPYVTVRASEGTVFDAGGTPIPGTGDVTTESGLGDIIASMTLYNLIDSQALGIAMDLTGEIKFATADEDKGLGTGEQDASVIATVYRFGNRFTFAASLGYQYRGDPSDVDLDNVLIASIGGKYAISQGFNAGLIFDFRESSIAGNDPLQEVTAFLARRASANWQIQFYWSAGLTDSSPDWGSGIQLRLTTRP